MVNVEYTKLSIRSQCRLLMLNRSSYYCQPKGESTENLAIMKKIDKIYLSHPYYGSRRMVLLLKSEKRLIKLDKSPKIISEKPTG